MDANKTVERINVSLLTKWTDVIDVLDIEYDIRSAIGYFYTITSDGIKQMLDAGVFDALPTEQIKALIPFYEEYQHQVLFRVEVRNEKIETLIGFENALNTFTVVLDENGVCISLKFYTHAIDDIQYKIKLTEKEEVYKNYEDGTDEEWYSICGESAYTNTRYISLENAIKYAERTKEIHQTAKDFTPTDKEIEAVLNNRSVLLNRCVTDYSSLLAFLQDENITMSDDLKLGLNMLVDRKYTDLVSLHTK